MPLHRPSLPRAANVLHRLNLGEAKLGLWRLADSYPVAQTEVLNVLPKLPSPMLSLRKANSDRLKNPRQGRAMQ